VAGAVTLPFGTFLTVRMAGAQDLPQLAEDDPQAIALKYVHDASAADAGERGGEDRVCANCNFYTGDEGSEWGSCGLFPGKAVNAQGWCAGWVTKS
jgi:hypothetical protein